MPSSWILGGNLLDAIATGGEGRRYLAHSLSNILDREVREAQRIPDDDERVTARITKGGTAFYADLFHAPRLHGYITVRTKALGETLVVSDFDEPLLSRWCHGAGAVVAWTSDLDHAWSREWVRWDGFAPFWSHVIRSSSRGAYTCPRADRH